MKQVLKANDGLVSKQLGTTVESLMASLRLVKRWLKIAPGGRAVTPLCLKRRSLPAG